MSVADTKQDVLDMLHELAELTILEEGDPQSFRVRAYESAAQSITAQASDLGKLTAKELPRARFDAWCDEVGATTIRTVPRRWLDS
jgi:DNA polymerase/3'-5' exonuclease PolX